MEAVPDSAPRTVMAGFSATADIVEAEQALTLEELVQRLNEGPIDLLVAHPAFAGAPALFGLFEHRWQPTLLLTSIAPPESLLEELAARAHRQRLEAETVQAARAQQSLLDEWSQHLRRELEEVLHELKTPVAVIEGYCSNLLDGLDGPLAADQSASIERIRASAHLMKEVIGHARTVATVPDVKPLPKVASTTSGRVKIDPVEWIRSVTRLFEQAAESQRVALQIKTEETIPQIWGDPPRLNQLLVNLVGNALRFTPEGGCITLSLSRQDRSEVDGTIRISVSDTGPGIDPQLSTDIFNAGVTSGDRAGLGLAISKQIADEHGAQLSADPGGNGAGATFHVVLPVDPRSRRATPLEVLLIEDSALAGQLLIELRTRYGNQLPVQRPQDMEKLASEILRSSSTIVFAGEVETRLQQRTMDLVELKPGELT